MTPPSTGYMNGNNGVGLWNPTSDSLVRHQLQSASGSRNFREDSNHPMLDADITELLARSRSQEEEILLLRKQIADASLNELKLLNEKHILERKLSDLRMVLDDKQIDAISDTMRELTQRKGYLEENLRLSNELKAEEEEMYIFNSSLLGLLTDFSIRPHVINASTICSGIKRLYHHMHWKIGSFESNYNAYLNDNRLESTSNQLRSSRDYGIVETKEVNFASSPDLQYSFTNEKHGESSAAIYKQVGAATSPVFVEDNIGEATNRKSVTDSQFYIPNVHETQASSMSEGEVSLPGIEGFQIVGEAKPGFTLRACGYPVNGTSLCIFQWSRHLQNGTRESIEGATVPDYVVTADDVDTFIAVDCIPMDDQGRQGEMVSYFANNQNKITCDPDMQHEIDTHISAGRVIFNVLLWRDQSEVWEQTILTLRRSMYHIKVNRTYEVVMEEKYSPDLCIKVPHGLSAQFVLICSDGSSLPFSTEGTSQPCTTENDIRLRDIIVLTMRNFQTKALDGKKKGKV